LRWVESEGFCACVLPTQTPRTARPRDEPVLVLTIDTPRERERGGAREKGSAYNLCILIDIVR
jgi:hypothetical protein